jgi:GDP-mannose 6-dehydrogenase
VYLGLGYVGAVSAACFAKEGHEVIGVDVSQTKVDIINSGNSPIIEEGINELINQMVAENRFARRPTLTRRLKIQRRFDGLRRHAVKRQRLAQARLRQARQPANRRGDFSKIRRHTVVMRSTMLPGTIESLVKPTLEVYSGKKAGKILTFASTPNFCAKELRSRIFTRRRLRLSARIRKKRARF